MRVKQQQLQSGFATHLILCCPALLSAWFSVFRLSKMLPCEHITPVLRQLHWLPVWQRIELKMAVLVYKSLNALSPQYLMDDYQLITTTGRWRLWLSNVATCDIPRTAQVWAIDPSLLLVHVCGTIYQFICGILSFANYRKRICLAKDRGA